MEFKTIIKFSSIHLAVLTCVLFLRFNYIENGDMNVVVFGTFIYLPYLLCLTFLNSTLLTLGLKYFKKGLLKWVDAALTPIALTIWFLSLGRQLEIHIWKVKENEFFTLNLIIIFLNLVTIYIINKEQNEEVT